MTSDDLLQSYYQQGHMGTSYIFAKVFSNQFGIENIIHFDSDTVFRNESLSLITRKFDQGYDVVGPHRCYRYNLNNRDDVRNQPDTIQTYFFGLKTNVLTKVNFDLLRKMCEGSEPPFKYWILNRSFFHKILKNRFTFLKYRIIDFFDPITYDALNNRAKFYFLDFNLVGGTNESGSKNNVYHELNTGIDFGENFIHFAGVGSGYSVYKGMSSPPEIYKNWALGRYAFYAKLFFDEEIGYDYDVELYKKIKKISQ